MYQRKLFRAFTILVLLGMLVSPFQIGGVSARPAVDDNPPPPAAPSAPVKPGGPGAQAVPLSKLDTELQQLATSGSTEEITVYVLAKEGTDLSTVAKVQDVRAFPEGELVVAKVEASKLQKLALNPDVQAAEAFHPIDPPTPITPADDGGKRLSREEIKQQLPELHKKAAETLKAGSQEIKFPVTPGIAAPSSPSSPNDYLGVGLIGAPAAWEKGFTGEGVNVAIIDSGVDFGNPDLMGTQATYDGGPYDGWPIALDPRSMRNLYYNGLTSWDNYYDWMDYTWYASVEDVIHCTQGITATFYFDPDPRSNLITTRPYYIDPSITAMSKSGEIRWSVHPDEQIYDWVWYDLENEVGYWIPFILVDTQTAGMYDTVIADLNRDFWFDQYDVMADKAQPVLAQDLGHYVYTDTQVMTGTLWTPPVTGVAPTLYATTLGYVTAPVSMTIPGGSWIWALNHESGPEATDGADGIPDISGGMVYYIADGKLPIPGMNYLYPDMYPLEWPAGSLVAFMIGSTYAGGGDHGTLCASATAATGQAKGYFGATGEWVQFETADYSDVSFEENPTDWLDWLKPADAGTVQGPAKGAKIIALGDNYEVVNNMQGFYDSYTFLAYGVDGMPNSGDEFVQVASMSYGDGYVHNDGWDWESRLLTYYNQHYLPDTAFLAASANEGHGFGSISEPGGSNTVIAVGASTLYGAETPFGAALALDQINDGDVQPFSGRGPNSLGQPDPDVVATGAWGNGDSPLNYAILEEFLSGQFFPGDGNNSWYQWGGTSRATPEAAGVMAQLYQAYKDANGVFPDFETARQILMSSADDLKHDVLMQGAGRVNADRATDVAGGLQGVYVSPSLLAAGEYDGTHYEAFTNVLFPGDSWSQTFTVHNEGASDASVTVGDEMLMAMDTITYTQIVTPYLNLEDPTFNNAYYYYANYFVGADPMTTTHGADLAIPVPADADFMQVQLTVPFEIFDLGYVDPYPQSVDYIASQRWSLTVYDWTDRNDDGKLWVDTNDDGIVNPAVNDDLVDIAQPVSGATFDPLGFTPVVTQTEINRFAYSYLYGNEQEVTVKLDESRKAGNIVLGLVHRTNNQFRDMGSLAATQKFYHDNPLTVKVVFYQKADWDLVDESPTSLNVPAGSTATFDADFTIPADQASGLYEGAITVNDGTHITIVPTTVNVAVPNSTLSFTLGGTPKADTPYDNGRGFGAFTWNGPSSEGDWRFFYYDSMTGFEQQYLMVRNQWGELCGNMPTWYDTLVWGPNPGDPFSMQDPGKYGPTGMQFAGSTPYANTYTGGASRQGYWLENYDGTALPMSQMFAALNDGLNMVQFRNTLLSGKHGCGEGFDATASVFGVDLPESGVTINTDQESGSFTVDVVSPLDKLWAYPYGFGEQQFAKNQDVPQGKHPYEFPYYNDGWVIQWPDDVMSGLVYTFTATNVDAIQIQTQGPWEDDLSLFLLYDANKDGLFNLYDNREWVDWSGPYGSDQSIWYNGYYRPDGEMTLLGVPDGTYALVIYGNYIVPGDQFDYQLALMGGDGLTIQGVGSDTKYAVDATPGVPQTFTVDWKVPGPGIWQGYLSFAPFDQIAVDNGVAEIDIPVFINKEAATVSIEKDVSQEMVDLGDIITYTIKIKNGGAGLVYLDMTDMLPVGLGFYPGGGDDLVDIPDGLPGYGGIQSALATAIPDFFASNCGMGYDQQMRTVHYSCQLPINYEGKMYAEDTISFQVRVEAQPGTEFLNKADLKWGYDGIGDIPYSFLSDTAYSYVRYKIFLPDAPR